MILCECGHRFEAVGETGICLACGRAYRLITASDECKVSASEDGVLTGQKGNVVALVRQVGDSGRDILAELVSANRIAISITAPPRHNEENVREVARILRERLNRDGGNWKEPEICAPSHPREEAGVDFILRDGASCLEGQVVRAPFRWREVALGETVKESQSLSGLADQLMNAIANKTRRIPPKQRASIFLVIDAIETPAYVWPEVVEHFRRSYGGWASSLGFAGIWVVGPTFDLTHKLV